MAFPQKNLNANETIVLDMHPHWWYFAGPASALLGSIIFGIFVLFMDDGGLTTALGWLALGLIVFTAIWTLTRYGKWFTTMFVLTSQRVIFRQGFISKSGMEIPLERVNNVNFHQGVMERLLGCGDVLIESGSEQGQQRFCDIRRPASVQNLIHAEVEKISQRRAGRDAQPSGAVDVAEQLERLEGMLQRGTLTQEEFDAQKHKLLG